MAVALIVASAIAIGSADARTRHHRGQNQEAAKESYQPAYASIVVDANSGAVMQASNADSLRHPASLTKIMTLYLLFERLEAGKIKMSTEMTASAHAAIQAPSKLGLKPGDTITVETAIRAIVTKSANDVAVIVAETLAGDETEFARLMTAKARALGMMHTTYYNASGLPDDRQMTTARDQAVLGRAIQDRFPNYYHYFSTRTFAYQGKQMRNHNHLLGVISGVDGIKTGYIHDSGFNIVTSVRRNNRHLVVVVFGGRTADARDARVRSMIDNNINIAAATRTAPPVIEGWETVVVRAKEAKPAVVKVAASPPVPTPAATALASVSAPATMPSPAPGSTEPIKPMPIKTIAVQGGVTHIASLSPMPSASRKLIPAPATANPTVITTLTVRREQPPVAAESEPAQEVKSTVVTVSTVAPPQKVASANVSVPVLAAAPPPAAKPRGGWIIQVGAFDDEKDAKERLAAAQSKAKDQLGKADPFTERVDKGDKAMFRARFAGLEKFQAETACKHLKRSEIPCMILKN